MNGTKWKEREWWIALLTPVLVAVLTASGMSEELVMTSVVPLVTWLIMRKVEKSRNGHPPASGS